MSPLGPLPAAAKGGLGGCSVSLSRGQTPESWLLPASCPLPAPAVLLYPPRPPSRCLPEASLTGRLAAGPTPGPAPGQVAFPQASDIKLPGLDPGLCLQGTPYFQEVMPLLKNLLGSPLGDRRCQACSWRGPQAAGVMVESLGCDCISPLLASQLWTSSSWTQS